MEERFIFYLGSERSGGNLLTRLLDSHSMISGPAPLHLVRTLFNNIQKYGDLNTETNWEVLINDIVDLFNHKLGIWQSKITKEELLKNIKSRGVAGIVEYVYSKEADNKPLRFIKENKCYQFYDQIKTTFTGTKFIYLVRDPRDVVLSFLKSPNHFLTLEEAADLWNKEQQEFMKLYNEDDDNILLIKYEELIAHPEEQLARICNFLGLEYEPSMLEFNQKKLTSENAHRIADWSNLSAKVLSDNAGKYKKELGKQQVVQVEMLCMEAMQILGYEGYDADQISGDKEVVKKKMNPEELSIRNERLAVLDRIIKRNQVQ